jgi:hypothetical protein
VKTQKATIVRDIQSPEGMLYKNSKITLLERKCSCTHGEKNIKVSDSAGRLFWIGKHDYLLDSK